ncbi:MAG: hypothetical protein HY360_10315 [Verrucomicrobia bacterium]|nr:hypothetical protein [Verrucomicrobiota bacterium]
MNKSTRRINFRTVLARVLSAFGPQHWWPADSPFEVCVGAVLTQNTAWTNVERAIGRLKQARALQAPRLLAMTHRRLAHLLRPTGYFNVKARRLRAFLSFFSNSFHGSIACMKNRDLNSLREQLLEVPGVGRETADSILLYALEKPIFVVDAYTRRIFSRHQWIQGNEDYDLIRLRVEASWKGSDPSSRVRDFNELHALLVAVGKNFCRPSSPLCGECPLAQMLPRRGSLPTLLPAKNATRLRKCPFQKKLQKKIVDLNLGM